MGQSYIACVQILLLLAPICLGYEELVVGQLKRIFLSNGTRVFRVDLKESVEGKSPALRLSVSCSRATIEHSLLITAQQLKGVSTWSIPYVENGYSYSVIEQTLCPLLNIDSNGSISVVTVILSTSSPTATEVEISSAYVEQFYQRLNQVTLLTVSPSAPAYLMLENPPNENRIRVRFSSMDTTSDICAIASIQKSHCPVNLGNSEQHGEFQTILSQSAINVQVSTTSIETDALQDSDSFFYVVVSVLSSTESCFSFFGASSLLVPNQRNDFNVSKMNSKVFYKNINVTIESVFTGWILGMSLAMPVILLSFFYAIALVWIILIDWMWFHSHPITMLLEERLSRWNEFKQQQQQQEIMPTARVEVVPSLKLEEPETDMEQSITKAMCDKVKGMEENDDNARNLDTSRAEATDGVGGIDVVVDDPDDQQQNNGRDLQPNNIIITESHQTELNKETKSRRMRPALHSVVFGSQYADSYKDFIMPTPHYPEYLHMSDASGSSKPIAKFSSTECISNPAVQSLQTDSVGGTMKSAGVASIPSYCPSISLKKSVVDQVIMFNRYRLGLDSRTVSEKIKSSISCEREGLQQDKSDTHFKAGENVNADAGSKLIKKESHCVGLCGNYMSDLEEFDETSHVQKKFYLLSWYLVAVIIFYAIPAYQLVVLNQNLLTISGNQDLCYFNSLCSYSWHSPLITFTAFNNLYSNIGYFMLGILSIMITYRRHQMHKAVVKVINNPFITSKAERVGVPQYYGISYAIGLSGIAIGLMSTAYHICPGRINFQFDSTFMYILISLGIFKLLESRSPDLKPGLHKLLVVMAYMILFVLFGVLFSHHLAFYILFSILHVATTLAVTIQIYFHWKINFRKWESVKQIFKDEPTCPPRKKSKLVLLLTTNIINWIVAIYGVAFHPVDFASFFLSILLVNYILYFTYYCTMKLIYKEWSSLYASWPYKPFLYLILALVFWFCSFYFHSRACKTLLGNFEFLLKYRIHPNTLLLCYSFAFELETSYNWLVPPARSRNGNRECLVLFFDSHDMWHFFSSLALFFTFLMLTTIDDNVEAVTRTNLRVF